MTISGPLADDVIVHRLGGADVGNLRLKPVESVLSPPGFSVLIGGTPAAAAAQLAALRKRPARGAAAFVMATATVGGIRSAGFDVIAAPTGNLPNHGRVTHPRGAAGFDDANLAALSRVFRTTTGSVP